MRLSDLRTPCLVLDRAVLMRNIAAMDRAVARHAVALRPHMKTAKSVEIARLAMRGGGVTVSTLAEAAFFAEHGIVDQILAAGITARKLAEVTALNRRGAAVKVITDDLEMAHTIAAGGGVGALIEIDCGEGRGGVGPEDPRLPLLADALGPALAGVLTHAGHSYAATSPAAIAAVAEAERAASVAAAERLRAAGHTVGIVSIGSTPTALHAETLAGITEMRPGVYMFGDLFQAQRFSCGLGDIAVTVLASVIGRRPAEHRLLIDAGALALSKDRSTEAAPHDYGFGRVLGLDGAASLGAATVMRAYQEHGIVACDPALPFPDLAIGALVRVAPNHACLTAAGHDRYHVVDGGDAIEAIWPRVNYW